MTHSKRSCELICLVVIAPAVSAITLVQAADPHHTMVPAGMPHDARVEVDTVVQINGVRPFDVTYINPNDDPRQQ